jgi:hypothetical protein
MIITEIPEETWDSVAVKSRSPLVTLNSQCGSKRRRISALAVNICTLDYMDGVTLVALSLTPRRDHSVKRLTIRRTLWKPKAWLRKGCHKDQASLPFLEANSYARSLYAPDHGPLTSQVRFSHRSCAGGIAETDIFNFNLRPFGFSIDTGARSRSKFSGFPPLSVQSPLRVEERFFLE